MFIILDHNLFLFFFYTNSTISIFYINLLLPIRGFSDNEIFCNALFCGSNPTFPPCCLPTIKKNKKMFLS